MIFDPNDWTRIAADGGGLLVVEGRKRYTARSDRQYLIDPPPEWVEAAKPCETCHGTTFTTINVGRRTDVRARCADCHDGKRIVTVQVKCEACGEPMAETDPEDHLEGCDDGLATVGQVTVTWGPVLIVSYGEWELGGDHPECVAIDDWGGAVHIEERKGQDDAYGWHVDIPPDVDPASLVGKWAVWVEVA